MYRFVPALNGPVSYTILVMALVGTSVVEIVVPAAGLACVVSLIVIYLLLTLCHFKQIAIDTQPSAKKPEIEEGDTNQAQVIRWAGGVWREVTISSRGSRTRSGINSDLSEDDLYDLLAEQSNTLESSIEKRYGKEVARAIATDSDIVGAHDWVHRFLDVIEPHALDEVRNRVADRVQKIIDAHRSTKREGAQAYRKTFFHEE